QRWPVSGTKHFHQRARREHRDRRLRRQPCRTRPIARGMPFEHGLLADQQRPILSPYGHHGTDRQISHPRGMDALSPMLVDAFDMQDLVDRGRAATTRRDERGIGVDPQLAELSELVAATRAAGAVPGSHCGRFVEKEELGVTTLRHHRAPAALELKKARDPRLALPFADDALPIVVQAPSIAHQGTSLGSRDDRPPRGYPILPWHLAPPVF